MLLLHCFTRYSTFPSKALDLLTQPVWKQGIMNALIPVLTLILATIFLKEKTTVLQKLCNTFCTRSCIHNLNEGNSSSSRNLVGIILLFVSSTSFSAYSVLVKKRSKEFSTTDISFVVTILGFVSFNR